jgi:hypothetical protein
MGYLLLRFRHKPFWEKIFSYGFDFMVYMVSMRFTWMSPNKGGDDDKLSLECTLSRRCGSSLDLVAASLP